MDKRSKWQFYEGTAAVPLYFFLMCLGLAFCLLAFQGYIHIYVLQDAVRTEAVTDGSYLFSKNPGRNNKYIDYRFQAEGRSYSGSAVVFRSYRAGQTVPVYYHRNNPEKNGLLKIHGLLFVMGAAITLFSAAGFWHTWKKDRRRA